MAHRKTKMIEADIVRRSRLEAWEKQARCCKYCFEPLTFAKSTAEHRVPKSKGGTNMRANIDAACAPCNRAKGSTSAKAFLAMLRHPEGVPFNVLMAWSRRRIWLATHRACRNIRRSVGLDNNTPVGRKAAA